MAKLNNLNTSHEAVDSLIIEARVSGSLETRFEVCAAGFLEAEDTGTGLVEHLDKRDVEVCGVAAEGQVDGCEGVLVRAVDHGGAAGYGPQGACISLEFVVLGLWGKVTYGLKHQ